MRNIMAAMLATAALAGCGGEESGPAAKAFNAERQAIDARDAASLRTRMVKPPTRANGGYEAMPSTIDARGESYDANAPAAPGREPRPPRDASLGYHVTAPSAVPPPPDQAADAALRRPDVNSAARMKREISEAERRRKATLAAQAKAVGEASRRRLDRLRPVDAKAMKSYRSPKAVTPAPANGAGKGATSSRPAAKASPKPGG